MENALCHTFPSLTAQILPGESYSLGIIRLLQAVFRLPAQEVRAVEQLTETKHSQPEGQFPLCAFCSVGLYKAAHRTDQESLGTAGKHGEWNYIASKF